MSTLFEELQRVRSFEYTQEDVIGFEQLHDEIRTLKKERNAVIVAHNYYRPEILKIADFVGDSLELSLMASKVTDADIIEFCGVHFMAETAKIVNPRKTVLLPNLLAGCQLADSAPAEDLEARIAELKREYPDLAVVSYVNTTAAVKALSDIICTSANAGAWFARCRTGTSFSSRIAISRTTLRSRCPRRTSSRGTGSATSISRSRRARSSGSAMPIPEFRILVHPECRPDVAALADAVLSTSGMVRFAKENEGNRFLVVTECGLSDRLAMEVPEKQFLKGCRLCTFMKVSTLEDVRDSLRDRKYEIEVPEPIRVKAELALRRMFEVEGK
jgi:quinolinate synthase